MILLKKALRSIWRGKRAYIACIALMALGIAVYVSFNALYTNLMGAEALFYKEQRFGEAFAEVRGMPSSAVAALESLPVVERAGARLTALARVVLPGKEEKLISLRVISTDAAEPEPLGAFFLASGEAPGEGDILLGEMFAEANGLKAGDTITLTIQGKQADFMVSGTAKSPEYVYAMPENGSLMPDNEAFGFAYITTPRLAAITGRQGLRNSVSFLLKDGISFDAAKPQLEDALTPYGLISLYGRKDHASAEMLRQEVSSIGGMATSMPMAFIFMAVIILYLMLKRVIEQERGTIGTLKAFGYSDFAVVFHYICYGLFVGGIGGVLGCIFGLFTANAFTSVYLAFFNLPALKASYEPQHFIIGLLIALVSGALGAFMGTRGVLKLNPGEAMRPAAPPITKSDVFAKAPFIKAILASHGFMAVRNITRNQVRSLFILVGIAFSFAMIGFTSSFRFYIDRMLLMQFDKVELYDVKASLREPVLASKAAEAVYGLESVTLAEPVFELPGKLRLANLEESILITGLEQGSRMRKIYDADLNRYFTPPRGGLIISTSLAKELKAARGDMLTLKTPYTGDDELRVPVLDIVAESLGMNAYMELGSLCDLLESPLSANAVILRSTNPSAVKDALNTADNVSAVTSTEEAKKVYADLLKTYGSLFVSMQLAGVGVAFAIITNTASISLSERKREYATLRVLGMHPREIAKIVGFEYWLLTAIGIWPGIPLLISINTALLGMMDTTLFTMPTNPPANVYVTAGALCFATVLLCNLLCARRIGKFDMVEVLKERE